LYDKVVIFISNYIKMTLTKIISIVLITYIMYYIISQILNFYGIGQNVYGIYLSFYAFLVLSVIVLA